MTNISPETFLAELKLIALKAAADAGVEDYVYQRQDPESDFCRYVHEEQGHLTSGCIIGRWAHELHGVPLTELARAEGQHASTILHEFKVGGEYPAYGGDEPLNIIQRLAREIQRLQDTGTGWLAAVEGVERQYRMDAFGVYGGEWA